MNEFNPYFILLAGTAAADRILLPIGLIAAWRCASHGDIATVPLLLPHKAKLPPRGGLELV